MLEALHCGDHELLAVVDVTVQIANNLSRAIKEYLYRVNPHEIDG